MFAQTAIQHYRDKKIVLPGGLIPKTLVFSDAIGNYDSICEIENTVRNSIFSVYGIGTWLTHDIIGNDGVRVKPLNMVIKLTEAKPDQKSSFIHCVKLTDSPEKHTGDPGTIGQYMNELFH